VRLEEKPFNLVECIETAIDIVEYRGVMKGLNIACFIDKNTTEMLIGDRSRLKQILINLLNNGIKFTEKGEVIIKVKTIEQDADQITIDFQVIDTGIGIKPEELELIFKPFGQIDSSYARAHTGSGLGLVICKNLCKLMNGKMWVTSDFGKGSTFGFSIPFKIYKDVESDQKMQTAEDNSIDWSVYYQYVKFR
jgi:two-component system sensor histidine kinase/response regulator